MGSARDVVGWVKPGDEGDVRRHTPSDSQWWFIQSPDGGYRDVRLMSRADHMDLDAAGHGSFAHGLGNHSVRRALLACRPAAETAAASAGRRTRC
eukprot:7056977-Prymnesium_polylepis.1